MKTKSIEFTLKEMETLVRLVYLGSWMQDAHLTTDPRTTANWPIKEKVFRAAFELGLKRVVSYVPELEMHSLTQAMEADLHEGIEQYDSITFMQELADEVGRRAAVKKYGKQFMKMDRFERANAILALSGEYEEQIADDFEGFLDRIIEAYEVTIGKDG